MKSLTHSATLIRQTPDEDEIRTTDQRPRKETPPPFPSILHLSIDSANQIKTDYGKSCKDKGMGCLKFLSHVLMNPQQLAAFLETYHEVCGLFLIINFGRFSFGYLFDFV